MSTWSTVLTSAAVGVLVSSIFALLGQYLERRSRRNELLLTKALEMAIRKSDISLEAAKLSNRNVTLVDDVINAETYLRWPNPCCNLEICLPMQTKESERLNPRSEKSIHVRRRSEARKSGSQKASEVTSRVPQPSL